MTERDELLVFALLGLELLVLELLVLELVGFEPLLFVFIAELATRAFLVGANVYPTLFREWRRATTSPPVELRRSRTSGLSAQRRHYNFAMALKSERHEPGQPA
ncbi:hypothetical protein [Bradyrhizobium cajani]|uniref:hypothetical protein n=1 Tax=Bradyrhizobium cajani TaxID=1928661 RepID=UPI00197A9F76|nr:hypothetical protein [Bradyrhizobium cajani]MCP3369435.1 hypothetical protein [Bradyrhizobium cajani]